MRDLKFRAWDKAKKSMSFLHTTPNQWCFFDGVLSLRNDGIKNFEVMQFVGLKDLDWWESDVLENDPGRWLIVFEEGCFCARLIGKFDVGGKFWPIKESMQSKKSIALRALVGGKKVGNKFENPELLK